MTYFPHDLIKLNEVQHLVNFAELPQWAKNSLLRAPFVVVRRGSQINGQIPVGIRGLLKAQRAAAVVAEENVAQKISPFQLVQSKKWTFVEKIRQQLPVFQALPAVVPILEPFEWGIGGSCEYELASGVPMVNVNSDLDIIVKHFAKLSATQAQTLLAKLNQFGVHIDLQVVTDQNGFSLEEFANARSRTVLIKTSGGPQLATDPWQAIQEL